MGNILHLIRNWIARILGLLFIPITIVGCFGFLLVGISIIIDLICAIGRVDLNRFDFEIYTPIATELSFLSYKIAPALNHLLNENPEKTRNICLFLSNFAFFSVPLILRCRSAASHGITVSEFAGALIISFAFVIGLGLVGWLFVGLAGGLLSDVLFFLKILKLPFYIFPVLMSPMVFAYYHYTLAFILCFIFILTIGGSVGGSSSDEDDDEIVGVIIFFK